MPALRLQAASTDLPDKSRPLSKNISLPVFQSYDYRNDVPPRHEGRIAIVTNARRDAMDVMAPYDVRRRNGRPSRVVLAPLGWC